MWKTTSNAKILFLLPLLFFCIEVLGQNQQDIQLANEYFLQGNLEKAKTLYDDLAGHSENIPFIHKNYLSLLSSTSDFKQANKYLNKVIRANPQNILYKIDQGLLYQLQNEANEAERVFKEVFNEIKQDAFKIRLASQHFVGNNKPELALEIYKLARQESGDPASYAYDLANLYRMMNEKDMMVQEFLNFANANPGNIHQVKNTLQNYLTEEEDLTSLEMLLYDKVQESPENNLYSDLLIWVNLQQKNFYGAFIQARALDKRIKADGRNVVDIGLMSLENKDYENAIKIFEYVVKTYKSGVTLLLAKRFLIKSREELVKNSFPVDREEIIKLVGDYEDLVAESGINDNTLEALRSKALLHAFYLDQKDTAIGILEQIIALPRADPQLSAASKIDLGDIFVLTGQPWESTLLYSQVEKSQKDQPLGYEAKLKNARLSYFKGDFDLAKAHLDVLKMATTREIANDAMALSLLIQDNTVFDTTGAAMLEYAAVELLLFQNKRQEALDSLDQMLVDFPGHSLTDEILYLQANILTEMGNFDNAIDKLDQMLLSHGADILGDDAFFQLASIYDRQMGDKDKAMEYYQDFLIKYPGSIFSAEARKRFRILRGDMVN